ncbi:Gfo/Idh/MocA family protein [Thalassobacillus devorans]|uniref:Gfo/Idh/MocA family protein n=1 Tax=Thalassobacillus devorans TaxID=279813 RepID=UPI00048D19E3|nr:Gfo/Idh/MocA family oxidoreductase [Thalassobacillus devorans]
MKIGIVGLGDIAKKAYLPVLSEKEGIELILCTRNKETLEQLCAKYRITEKVQTVEELIEKDIDGAIVSAATEAHVEIAEKLLSHGVHTYIDKPISMHFHETQRIVQLAEENRTIAMVGFNRRFIPPVKALKEKGKPNLVIMQKNRFKLPDYVRRFVVEDFIHVVDTLRFLMDTEVKDIHVRTLKNGDMMDHLIIQLAGDGCTAMGIMDRNGGVTEETIEYSAGNHKYVIKDLVETTHYHNKEICLSQFGGWDPTLYKRGFYQITEHFIDCIANNRTPDPSIQDSFTTHEICEQIVAKIESE